MVSSARMSRRPSRFSIGELASVINMVGLSSAFRVPIGLAQWPTGGGCEALKSSETPVNTGHSGDRGALSFLVWGPVPPSES